MRRVKADRPALAVEGQRRREQPAHCWNEALINSESDTGKPRPERLYRPSSSALPCDDRMPGWVSGVCRRPGGALDAQRALSGHSTNNWDQTRRRHPVWHWRLQRLPFTPAFTGVKCKDPFSEIS